MHPTIPRRGPVRAHRLHDRPQEVVPTQGRAPAVPGRVQVPIQDPVAQGVPTPVQALRAEAAALTADRVVRAQAAAPTAGRVVRVEAAAPTAAQAAVAAPTAAQAAARRHQVGAAAAAPARHHADKNILTGSYREVGFNLPGFHN